MFEWLKYLRGKVLAKFAFSDERIRRLGERIESQNEMRLFRMNHSECSELIYESVYKSVYKLVVFLNQIRHQLSWYREYHSVMLREYGY